jgi:hypothetical protein
VSCQSGICLEYKGRATFTAQPKASPVPPLHAAGVEALTDWRPQLGLQVQFVLVQVSSGRVLGPGTNMMQGEASDDPMRGTSFARSDTGRDHM